MFPVTKINQQFLIDNCSELLTILNRDSSRKLCLLLETSKQMNSAQKVKFHALFKRKATEKTRNKIQTVNFIALFESRTEFFIMLM